MRAARAFGVPKQVALRGFASVRAAWLGLAICARLLEEMGAPGDRKSPGRPRRIDSARPLAQDVRVRLLLMTLDFPPVCGGMTSYYWELMRHSDPAGLAVIAPRCDAPHADGELPFPVHRLRRKAGRLRTQLDLLLVLPELRGLVRDIAPDCLLVGNFRPFAYLARALQRSVDIPYLPVLHGMDLMRLVQRGASSRWRRRGYDRIGKDAAGFVVNTAFTGKLLEQHFPHWVADCAVTVLHPGVDTRRFRPGPEPDRPRLLTVARYAPRKGMDTVLRAMPRVLESVPDLIYRVVGTGDRAPYQALAETLGIAHSVELQGPATDAELPGLYRDCSLFVMLPRVLEDGVDVEGFGMVYLEANASGRPVLAADSGGIAEAVADGVSGLMVPPDDPAAAAEAIVRLLRDPALRRRLGEAGRRRAEEEFSWTRQAEILQKAARAACGG
jgi:phosphatidylinositol alpha-1,6-mannosyltransferase